MYPSPLVPEIVVWFVILGAGLYLLRRAWRLLKFPTQATLPVLAKVAIGLRWIFEGEEVAKKLQDELTTPANLQRSGIYMLIAGCMFVVSGTIQVVVWFLAVVGVR